jgi:YidC/Oxa1 family membrane protein insertase
MRRLGRTRLGLAAVAGLLALVVLALPNAAGRAASPTPTAVPTATSSALPAAAGGGAAPTPFATPRATPCPNPTPTTTPSPAPGQTPAPTAHPNLCPAVPNGADPTSLIAFAFTPIFQAIFLVLMAFYDVIGDIGLAIILVTIVIRLLLVPLFRRQLMSQRRMQLLQPELAEAKRKYKGDRQKQQQAQMQFYKDRDINPAGGCLPSMLQLLLLFPMYYVFSSALLAPDISAMLTVFGQQILHVGCQDPTNALVPCIQTHVAWLGGMNVGVPEILFTLPVVAFPVSALAVVSALLQLVQSRMMMPAAIAGDQNARTMQTTYMILPFISIVYGAFLPAGLFLYWIVTTIFSIVQQYLTIGWGSFFPILGRTPSFAVGHRPRFGIREEDLLAPKPKSGRAPPMTQPARSPGDSSAGTIRPARKRGSSNRRGRRR